ncbi:MAG: TlpA family protein disulfide reductase [Acidobacteria bacterium]|nr:TlpA family protein disulfide reductase [Acidobacteriota bacterium]
MSIGGPATLGGVPHAAAGPITPGRAPLDADARRWVDETLASLTLRQQVAQLVIQWLPGSYASTSSAEFQEWAGWVEDDEIGGGSMVKVGRTNRWTLPAVVALGIVTAVATALSATAQEPDERLAIDFHATRLDGTLFNGATLEGQVVLLDFWAVWCRPCIEAFPTLNHLAEELADHDVALIGVAVHSGSPEEVADFLEEHDIQFPLLSPTRIWCIAST